MSSLAPRVPHHGPDELWLASGDEPQSIDPALCNDSVGTEVINNLFAGLVQLDGNTLAPVPDLAQTWAISADGRTYTFILRPSVWSDGTPLTAEDFVYSFKRILDPSTGCRFASMLYIIEGAKELHQGISGGKGFGAVASGSDLRTLTIILKAPTPYFLPFLSYNLFRPVPRHLLQRLRHQHINEALWTRPEHVVVSGAYRLKSWRFKRDHRLEKNPRYWDAARVRLSAIWVQMVPSAGTAINLYRAGAIDWTGPSHTLPAAYVAHLSRSPDFYREPMLATYFYWLNTKRPPLDDVRVRRALSLAVDRRALTEDVLRGGQIPTASLVPPGVGAYPPVAPEGVGGLDIAEAQRLLREAGYGPQHPLPPLTLIYNTAESHKQIALALQGMWQTHLGVQVSLENQEWRVFLQHVAEKEFDLARMGWAGDYPDAFTFLSDVLGQQTGNNMSGWHNARFEALLAAAAQQTDVTRRQRLMHDSEAMALKEAPLIPLFVSAHTGLIHPKLKGLRLNAMGLHPYKDLYFELPETVLHGAP